MIKSSSLSTKHSQKNSKFLFPAVSAAILGLADATYLTILHYENKIPPCSITHGCENVLTSKFATIYSIPISILGIIFYLTWFVFLMYLIIKKKNQTIINLLLGISLLGIVVSAILFYLQVSVIKAYCQFCMASEVVNMLLLVFAYLIKKDYQKEG